MFVLKYEAQIMFLCVGATQAEGCRCTAVKHGKMSTVRMEEGGTTSIERAVGFTILQAAQNNCIIFSPENHTAPCSKHTAYAT